MQFVQKRMMNIVVDRTCYTWLYAWLNVQKHVLTQMQTKSINTEKCADQKRYMLIYRLVSGRGMQKAVQGLFTLTCRCPAVTPSNMAESMLRGGVGD